MPEREVRGLGGAAGGGGAAFVSADSFDTIVGYLCCMNSLSFKGNCS